MVINMIVLCHMSFVLFDHISFINTGVGNLVEFRDTNLSNLINLFPDLK